ncbi:hypothetical protein LF1_55540 [Rubripirellula obstinata]|uniref:PD(D/E)XK endonuclease domain-containing protein n=1 Tax=Rubripirellula obstinata TaxID=406547 RepID=A0A5B1CCT4_9BACT|nr:hypothetical protein LF1_55540 [Rubripirellula obstinata]
MTYMLSTLGFIAALVREGAPTIDILASNLHASRTIGIQVKTTASAMRTRGRGKNKVPHELQFPLGHKAVEHANPGHVFCFVDLLGQSDNLRPDVYIVPASIVTKHYEGQDIRKHSYFRLHWPVSKMLAFQNDWSPIVDLLSDPSDGG